MGNILEDMGVQRHLEDSGPGCYISRWPLYSCFAKLVQQTEVGENTWLKIVLTQALLISLLVVNKVGVIKHWKQSRECINSEAMLAYKEDKPDENSPILHLFL